MATASLALAWGLCDLFGQGGAETNLRFLNAPEGGEGDLSGLANALCGEGERVCLRQ